MRVFYVLYVPEVRLRSAIDTIRLLYDPAVSHPAHITLRGPYTQRLNVNALSAAVAGQQIVLHNVDHFFSKRGNTQHTVYFEAHSPALRKVWMKSDFDFRPHLTLYDGPPGDARRLALELYQAMARLPITVAFIAKGLEPLISGRGQTNLNVLNGIDFDFVSEVTRTTLNRRRIFEVEDRQRTVLVDRICRYLSQRETALEFELTEPERPSDIRLASGWSAQKREGRGRAHVSSSVAAGVARTRARVDTDDVRIGLSSTRMRELLDGLWATSGVSPTRFSL